MTDYQSLEALCTYLNISKGRIKRHPIFERSVIQGRKGYIYIENGYVVAIENVGKTKYSWIKNKHLAFMELVRVIIDDQPLSGKKASVFAEFRLDRMPSSEEAKAIRKVLQIRERRILTDEQKQALRDRLLKNKRKTGVGSSLAA